MTRPNHPARASRQRRGMALLAAMPWAVSFGCTELPASARETLVEARELYRAKQYAAAKSKSDSVIKRYSAFGQTAEAYYLRALCHVELGDRSRAAEDAQRCIAKSSDPVLTARAHATTASILFEQRRHKPAVSHYKRALKNLPEDPGRDLVHFNYGVCLQRVGDWRGARAQFSIVQRRYPTSSLAERARRAAAWPHEYFSIQCGAYRDRGAAETLANSLKGGRGRPAARVQMRVVSGQSLHTVLVGRFPTYDEAQSALGMVRRRAGGAFVVP